MAIPEGLMADAPLSAGKSCLLPLMGDEMLLVPGVHGFARAGFIPEQFDPFFFCGCDLGKMEG